MTHAKWVLGIDGGGSKTDAVLVGEDGSFGAEEHAGPSNLFAVGVERTADLVLDVAKRCCLKVDSGSENLFAVGIGLAGAGRSADRVAFHQYLSDLGRRQDFPMPTIVVETDWRIALEAAFPTSAGIVLISGTGSIACARGEDGTLHRAGGFGKLLGDEGSAYALGREALNAALRSHEGREERTALLEYAIRHFDAVAADDLIGKVYREHVDIASFAPRVMQAATERDAVAHSILAHGAQKLSDLVRILAGKIGAKKRIAVSLMGRLIQLENPYSQMVKKEILSALPGAVIQRPKFPPAYGAAILAFQPFTFPQ